MPNDLEALLRRRNAFLDRVSWKLIPVLILGQLLVLVPGVLYPRTTVPAVMAWTLGVLFWFFHSMESQRRYKWGSLLLGLVGVGISLGIANQGWEASLIGDASRRAGGIDWLAWVLIALTLPIIIKSEARWRWILVYLAVLGEIQSIVAIAEPYLMRLGTDDLIETPLRYGLTANPAFLGLYAMVGAIASLFLLRSERVFGVVLVVCLGGLWVSGTHAGFLGLMVALPFTPYRLPVRMAGVLALAVPSVIMFDTVPRFLWWEALKETLYRPWGHGFMTFSQEAMCDIGCDFPQNMVLQIGYETGVLGWVAVGVLGFYGRKRLRGPWAALGAAFALYSLFWIPSPGWFLMLAILIARVAWMGTPASERASEEPITENAHEVAKRRRRKGFPRS